MYVLYNFDFENLNNMNKIKPDSAEAEVEVVAEVAFVEERVDSTVSVIPVDMLGV